MNIEVKNFIDGDVAVSYEAGKECYKKECEALRSGDNIVLDFSGISYVITAFLNPIIGDLILEKGNEVMKNIQIINANEQIIKKIKQVKDGSLLKREDVENGFF